MTNLRPGVLTVVILFLGLALLQWVRTAPVPLAPRALPLQTVPDNPPATTSFGTANALPAELSDGDFWKIISEFSEPGGSFIYDNFLSNEKSYQQPIPALKKIAKSGGVYLGVGPEQNFTYIAAIRPQIAFIIDIRRQNMLELLMYKALFEMSRTRADFVSLLFSRKRPGGLNERSSAEIMFDAYQSAEPDPALFDANLQEIKGRLMKFHGFELSYEDQQAIDHVYKVFFSVGPDLSYSSLSPGPAGPSYEALMTLTDSSGRNWSYLATEENFQLVREMQARNMIVPIVGDFAGVKAIRTLGRYLKDHNATVTAFYLSNVEMYILPAGEWRNFCNNVAALPVDESSRFIRFVLAGYSRYIAQNRSFLRRMMIVTPVVSVLSPMTDVIKGVEKGYLPSYFDLLSASQ